MTQTDSSEHRILTVQQPASSPRSSSPPEPQLRKTSNILSLTGRMRRNLTYSQWKAKSNNMTSTDKNNNLDFCCQNTAAPQPAFLPFWLKITSHKQMVTGIKTRNAFPDVHYFLSASLKLNLCLYNTEHLLLSTQYPEGKSNLNSRSLCSSEFKTTSFPDAKKCHLGHLHRALDKPNVNCRKSEKHHQ